MKIVHFITGLGIGGAESSLYNLLLKFDHKSNEHVVMYLHDGPNAKKISELVKTYHIKGIVSPYDPIGIARAFMTIKSIKPDILHTALWSANIIGRLIGKFLRIPVICDLHSDVRYHGRFRNLLEHMTIKLPSKFIAVSESVEEAFRSEMKSNNTIVINNGIDAGAISRINGFTKVDLGFEEKDFVIGAIGRLVPIKSYDTLIKAFKDADIKNSVLCIVGDGPERKRLEKLSAGAKIVFMGHRTDAIKFYSAFDCFVLPSESEGLSIAFLEALSFGLPIISTCKLLVNNKNGFIVPTKDVLSIKTALIKLHNDPIARKLMGLENINLVKEKFNINAMTTCYERLYASILRV